MPPFSPGMYGVLPNSRKLFCPEKPCQPWLRTHGGSIRPVETLLVADVLGPFAIEKVLQFALSQYTAPGTRRLTGREAASTVFALFAAREDVGPHGG